MDERVAANRAFLIAFARAEDDFEVHGRELTDP
jgi:hypothetical protein